MATPDWLRKARQTARERDERDLARASAGGQSALNTQSAQIASRLDNPINSPSATAAQNLQSAQIANRLNTGAVRPSSGRQAQIVQAAKDYKSAKAAELVASTMPPISSARQSAQIASRLDNSLMGQATRDKTKAQLESAAESLYNQMEIARSSNNNALFTSAQNNYNLIISRLDDIKKNGGSLVEKATANAVEQPSFVPLSVAEIHAVGRDATVWNNRLSVIESRIPALHEQVAAYDRLGMTAEMTDAQAELEKLYAEKERLERQISSTRQTVNLSERANRGAEYNALMNADDFEEYAEKGASVYVPSREAAAKSMKSVDKLTDNPVKYYRDNWDSYAKLPYSSYTKEAVLYHHMTDDEFSIYNYLLGKEGKDAANEYLDFIREELNIRAGKAEGEAVNALPGVLKAPTAAAYSIAAGVEQFGRGLQQLTTDERLPTSKHQAASQTIQDDLGTVGKTLYGVGVSVGNMLPSIVISAATGGLGAPGAVASAIGSASMGLSSSGNAYNAALQEGYTKDQARTYAALVGGSEATLQYLLGGIGSLGGVTDDVLLAKVAGIDNAFARIAATGAIKIGSEVTEEEIQMLLEPAFRSLIFETDYDAPTWEEAAETAIMTALSTGLLEAGGVARSEIDRKNAQPPTVESIMPTLPGQQKTTQPTGEEQVAQVVQDLTGQTENAPVNDQPVATPTLEQPKVTANIPSYLYSKRDGKGGWGKRYATAQEALNSALQAVSPKLWSDIEAELDSAMDKRNYPTPKIDALVSVVQDVRQDTLTPIQGALLLKDTYEKGGTDALINIRNPYNGNLYESVLEAAKQIDTRKPKKTAPAAPPAIRTVEPEAQPAMGAVGDMGAKTSEFPHKVVKSQTHAIDNTEELLGVPEEQRTEYFHDQVTEAESLHNAKLRLEQDYEGEKEYLRNTLQWTGEDVDVAYGILSDLENEAMYARTEAAWDKYHEWRDIVHQHGGRLGSGLQALAKHARKTGSKIVERASEIMADVRKGTDRAEVMNVVADYAKQYDKAVGKKDVDELVRIIKNTSVKRHTGTLLHNELSKSMNWALDRIAGYAKSELANAKTTKETEASPVAPKQNYTVKEGDRVTVSDRNNIGTVQSVNDDGTYTIHFKSRQGTEATKTFSGDMVTKLGRKEPAVSGAANTVVVGRFYDFLENFAASGIEAIATDKQKTSIGKAALTIRRNAMLSKAASIMRNLVGNNVFDPLDSVANNMSVPLDALLSVFTKTRSVAFDRSWASEAKRKGSLDGLAMAMLEVGLDVNTGGATSKYETNGTRTFHMANGVFSKLMSQWEKYMGYAMTATDEFQKGGIAAETQRGIDRLYEKGKIKDDTLRNAGEQEALYRTFQKESIPAQITQGVRQATNAAHIGDIGLGDVLIPFAQVPANLPAVAADYSPIGLARGIGKMAKVLIDAKKGKLTAVQQASAVKDIGRGVTGSGMIAIAATLAAKGIIRVANPGGEEENKDKAASEKSQGLTGTQWNLSATMRAVNGESTEWQDGDTLMSISFLDPINAQLTTGALIAEDVMEADENGETVGFGQILGDSLSGAIQSFLDLPVMQTMRDVANAYQYSDGETTGEKAGDAATAFASSFATSFIPNALKGIAQGLDPYQRDLYSKDGIVGQTVDQVIGSIPGLRERLQAKQDAYGNDIKNPEQPLNFLNSNILPGAITKYTENDLQAALNKLAEDTGVNTAYLSRNAPKSFEVDGKKVELTDEQQRQYKAVRGDTYEMASAALEGDETYQGFSNEWKLKAYEFAEDYANQTAKESLDAGFEPDTWVQDLEGATPEEFADALVKKVVENIAGKKGENESLGLATMLEERSIDDQLALSCMSETAVEAYTNNCEKAGISVQQYLDAYGTAYASGKNEQERKQAALDYISGMDLSSEQKGALAQAVHEAIGNYVPLETEVPEQWLLDTGDASRIESQMSKEQRERYDVYIKDSVDMQAYIDFRAFLGSEEAKAKKDENDETIKGESKQDHAIAWLEAQDLSNEEKGRLFCSEWARSNCPAKWRAGLPKMPKK